MPSSDITYTTRAGETFGGRLSVPEGGGKAPGILMITAIFGIDKEMEELADAWAADGFVVSTPDIFWRQIPGPTADMEVAFKRYNDFDFDQGIKDIEDLMNDLRNRPECNGKVGVLGFCFGGRYAHLAASRFGANAAGSFHGTMIGKHLDETDKVTSAPTIRLCQWMRSRRSGRLMPATPMPRSPSIPAHRTTSPCRTSRAIMPRQPPHRVRRC